MRTSRRTFAWIAILGVAIALLVIVQWSGDEPVVNEAAGSTPPSPSVARTTQQVVPAATSAAPLADSGDEALTKCTQTVSEAADFAEMERNAAPGQALEPDEDQLLAELGAAQRRLAGSRDPEDFLVALLLDPPKQRTASDATTNDATAQTKLFDLGDRAVKSGSKLLAWHALRACAAAKQSCPVAHLEQRLLEADRQNAEAWALVATLRYKRGDGAGALAAMQGAAHAPTSTWYWSETIKLIERSLAAQTTMPYAYRMSAAIGAAAGTGLPSDLGVLRDMCKVESVSSRAWGESCLALGRLRGERNETVLARSLAYTIREQALTALGDTEGAAEVAADRAQSDAERRAISQGPAGSMMRLQTALLETDLARLHSYLDAVQQYGEVAGARMFLREEVPPLLQRAGLLERDGVKECVGQFFVGTPRATTGQQAKVADALNVSLRSPSRGGQRTVWIRPDGKITLPFFPGPRTAGGTVVQPEREILAAGKTTAQLQREISTMLAEYIQSPEIVVTLLSPGSPEDLRLEFNNAQREAAERRGNPR